MSRAVPLLLLVVALGCTPQTIVTTTVTSPTPITQTTPASTTAPGATCPTGTCGSCSTGTCAGTTTPTAPTLPGARTPEILSFGSDTPRISKGYGTILRWEISDPAAIVRIDPGVGNVGTVGFLLVTPTMTTTYTLTARNALGIVQRTVTIVVTAAES